MSFNVIVASATFNRPNNTTAYSSGDLVADSTTAGSVTPLNFSAARVSGGAFMIRRARLKKSGTTTTAAKFRLHLYGASPTGLANGDGAAWQTHIINYIGSIDFDASGTDGRAFDDGAFTVGVPNIGVEVSHRLASGSTVYGLLEALAAYAPDAQETFLIELEVVQN